jgi:ABC-2 type transport system ATP-binding protein
LSVVECSRVSKSFGDLKAVNNVTFSINKGEIFGLLGPNGAGKTTIIRLLLNILKPESGQIAVLGGPMDESKKERIGYMPEERGLYQDIILERVLTYMATLKGVGSQEARQIIRAELEKFDLSDYSRKKVKDLSKGMQQKAQIIATLAHKPELVIVDEPFSGLDPVNTQLVKETLLDLRCKGTTIIMSTHQMHQVEELCDRILLINRGRVVLYGKLNTIRKKFSGNSILLRTTTDPGQIPGVEKIENLNNELRLTLAPETRSQEILDTLRNRGIPLDKFEIAIPKLDEIFVQVVKGDGKNRS